MPPTNAILSSSSRSHSSSPQGHVLRALLAKHPQMYTVTFYSTQASNTEIKTPQKQKGLLVGFREGKQALTTSTYLTNPQTTGSLNSFFPKVIYLNQPKDSQYKDGPYNTIAIGNDITVKFHNFQNALRCFKLYANLIIIAFCVSLSCLIGPSKRVCFLNCLAEDTRQC